MDQAKKHQILYTEIRRVPKGQRIFFGELISGGGDQPPWPSWTEGMLAPYDCIVYERSESLLDDRVAAAPTSVECDPKSLPWDVTVTPHRVVVTPKRDHGMEIANCGLPHHPESRERADFIVRACNSHHELLEALRDVLKHGGTTTHEWLPIKYYRKAEAAIANAERAGVAPE